MTWLGSAVNGAKVRRGGFYAPKGLRLSPGFGTCLARIGTSPIVLVLVVVLVLDL